jgi:hypothetical protein
MMLVLICRKAILYTRTGRGGWGEVPYCDELDPSELEESELEESEDELSEDCAELEEELASELELCSLEEDELSELTEDSEEPSLELLSELEESDELLRLLPVPVEEELELSADCIIRWAE